MTTIDVCSHSALASAWMKYRWASSHLDQFIAGAVQLKPLMHGKPRFDSCYEPDRGGLVTVVTIDFELPLELGLIIGDCVGAFRAALDHLAWASVAVGSEAAILHEPKKARQVSLPIPRDDKEPKFSERMPGSSAAVREVVMNALRPGEDGSTRLHTLDDLVQVDKHRTTTLTAVAPIYGQGHFIYTGFASAGEATQQLLETGAGLALEIFTPGTPTDGSQPGLTVRGEITADIVLNDERAPAEVQLKAIRHAVFAVLREADPLFPCSECATAEVS